MTPELQSIADAALGGAAPNPASESATDGRAELRRLHESAVRSAQKLRQCAVRARRENDPALSAFFERCARSDEARAVEAKELLRSQVGLPAATSAAFAAGDGATDADVSPDSWRPRVGTWPVF